MFFFRIYLLVRNTYAMCVNLSTCDVVMFTFLILVLVVDHSSADLERLTNQGYYLVIAGVCRLGPPYILLM